MTSAPNLKDDLCDRLTSVIGRINAAAARAQRSARDITLIAISKTHSSDRIRTAVDCGVRDVGENRLQEAEPKIHEVGRDRVRWHLVGHLQANKARKAVRLFDVMHSLDSVALAKRLDRLCSEESRDVLPVLIQVNLGGEETKSGVDERDLFALVEAIQSCERLKLTGLMSVPPYFEDAERVRPFFSRLRQLRDDLKSRGSFGSAPGELSMGMTHDFEVGIEEGATMVRIGTAIFGERL
ncbi:MAG TPA: YggS family pyridoxal phosphate-dependent enzyme [Pyrinomonadaceae bacterium]|nr:YggS family pyridoxal phosphate-dependent enzyme [Pyrinomonadaceae bacterium]